MKPMESFIHKETLDYDYLPFLKLLEDWAQIPDFPSHWKRATVGTGAITDKRSNYSLGLDPVLIADGYASHPVTLAFKELHLQVDDVVNKYKELHQIPLRFDNGWAVNRYSEGAQYITHFDWSPMESRSVSVVVMLNDVEKGGDLVFPQQKVSVEAKAGNIAVFPSSYPFAHASMPVVSGVKYSLVSWLG